jgi:hypothetical protein
MVTAALVDSDIEIGQSAVEALAKEGVPAPAALWLYESEAGEWRLLIATPIVDKDGPLEAYKRIQRALVSNDLADRLPLSRVAVVSPKLPLVTLLRKALKTGPGIHRIRFTNSTIKNVLIEDALIYRLS